MAARLTIYHEIVAREVRRMSTPGRIAVASEAAAEAVATAPVDSGQYRNGIHVEVSGDDVKLVDDDETAIHKEFGTSDTPAHAVLTDAARKRGRYSGMTPKPSRRR